MKGLEGGFVLGRRKRAIGDVRGNYREETGLKGLTDIAGT